MSYDLRRSVLDALDVLIAFDCGYEGVPWSWTQSPNSVRLVLSHRLETLLLDDRVTLPKKDAKPLIRLVDARSLVRFGGERLFRQKEEAEWKRLKEQAEIARPVVESLPPLPPPVGMVPDLRVERFTVKRVDNPAPPRERRRITERFWEVRSSLRVATGRHGVVGPDDEPPEGARADYWLVEDQYSDERYQYMEVYTPVAATPGWLADVIRVLQAYPGWGIGVSGLYQSYLLIFGDRLMVKGDGFRSCETAAEVIAAMPSLIEQAAAVVPDEEE